MKPSIWWHHLILCPDLLLPQWIPKRNASPHYSRQSNACLLMQAPSDTNRVNITQLQTMSNTFLSCGLSLTQTQRAPLPHWQFRDRLCLHSDPPSSPSPLSLTHVCQTERPAEVSQTWQEALIYSHFEIKEGEALTLNMTNERCIDFLSLLETGPECVCRTERLLQMSGRTNGP